MHKTSLHDWHVSHGGRMVDFAGWSMPVLYASIVDEHHAVRRAAGLFDISHMGRLRLSGEGVVPFVEELVTCPVATLKIGRIRYGLVTNAAGGVLDDVLVYRVDEDRIDLVVNAANREKLIAWFEEYRAGRSVSLADDTFATAMLALQGPRAAEWLGPHVDLEVKGLRFYRFVGAEVFGVPARVSRTGYTGEDGFEFIVPAAEAVGFTDKLLTLVPHLAEAHVRPCGLGSRDTLRLEAAMPLYGYELSESIDPISAGLAFAVGKKKSFTGSEEIARRREEGPTRVRVGLELEGRRIAREGMPVLAEEGRIGEVTSGTLSPTLGKSIAMAFVDAGQANPGANLNVELKGKLVPACVVELPFYRRPDARP